MTPRQLLQTPAGQSRMACYSPISSDDEKDEIEEGFVFLRDEVFARWVRPFSYLIHKFVILSFHGTSSLFPHVRSLES